MKIDKLAQLFSAPSPSASAQSETINQNSAQPARTETGAVTVASDFGSGGSTESAASREARVAQIKQAVETKSYNPDSRAVAEKVAAELFA